jgi:hypothetical protein
MSLAILFACAASIFSMIYHLYQARKNRKLRSKDFISRLGALTQGQRKSSFTGVYWRPIVLLRWTATMLIMTLLRQNFYLQIFLLLVISVIFQGMIVCSKPLLNKLDNNMLLFNEIMVAIYLYQLLCITDFMVENGKRDIIAWALLSTVVSAVVVNLVKFLLVCDWCFISRKIKKKCLKHKKYEKENEDNKKSHEELNDLTNIGGQSEKGKKNKRKNNKNKLIKKNKKVRSAHKVSHT